MSYSFSTLIITLIAISTQSFATEGASAPSNTAADTLLKTLTQATQAVTKNTSCFGFLKKCCSCFGKKPSNPVEQDNNQKQDIEPDSKRNLLDENGETNKSHESEEETPVNSSPIEAVKGKEDKENQDAKQPVTEEQVVIFNADKDEKQSEKQSNGRSKTGAVELIKLVDPNNPAISTEKLQLISLNDEASVNDSLFDHK